MDKEQIEEEYKDTFDCVYQMQKKESRCRSLRRVVNRTGNWNRSSVGREGRRRCIHEAELQAIGTEQHEAGNLPGVYQTAEELPYQKNPCAELDEFQKADKGDEEKWVITESVQQPMRSIEAPSR